MPAKVAGSDAVTPYSRPFAAPADALLVVVADFVAIGADGILTPVMAEGGFSVDPAAPLARDVFADYLKLCWGPLSEGRCWRMAGR